MRKTGSISVHRSGRVNPGQLKALIIAAWEGQADRGAEERKALEVLGLREQRLVEINRLEKIPTWKCMRVGMTASVCCSRCRILMTLSWSSRCLILIR